MRTIDDTAKRDGENFGVATSNYGQTPPQDIQMKDLGAPQVQPSRDASNLSSPSKTVGLTAALKRAGCLWKSSDTEGLLAA